MGEGGEGDAVNKGEWKPKSERERKEKKNLIVEENKKYEWSLLPLLASPPSPVTKKKKERQRHREREGGGGGRKSLFKSSFNDGNGKWRAVLLCCDVNVMTQKGWIVEARADGRCIMCNVSLPCLIFTAGWGEGGGSHFRPCR